MDMGKKNPSDIDKARGLRLEKLFELNRLSNADVARTMKRKSRAVPGRWCSGESFLTDPEEISKLARILGTTTEYILYGTGPAQASTSSYPVPQELPLKETEPKSIPPTLPAEISSAELVKFFMEQCKEQQATIKELQKKICDLEAALKESQVRSSHNNLKKTVNGISEA